jgi:2-polyprenyl-6-hydroxyphenyl methylase/3-demethylubiquinone-9 3-methyltransferase
MSDNSNTAIDAVDFHDRLASTWDDRYLTRGFRRRAAFFESEVLPYIPTAGAWLDAGCGTGYFSRMLSDRGMKVTGVDASRSMIEAAINLAGKSTNHSLLQFEVVETVERLPFDDQSFSGCICLSVLEYLQRPGNSLDELARILKPGGMLVISVPDSSSFIRKFQKAVTAISGGAKSWGGYEKFSKFSLQQNELKEELALHGLSLQKMVGFDVLVPKFLHSYLHPSLIYAIATKNPC